MPQTPSLWQYGNCERSVQYFLPSILSLALISVMFVHDGSTQMRHMGQMGAQYQGTFESYNKFGLPSLIIPVPCQANKLQEQVNYICAHGNIWCLPGWKVFLFFLLVFIII